MNLVAQMSWTQWSLAALMIGICLLMMLVILLQKGRGQGLSGAFGGGGGGGAFGAKTGDIFTWVTIAFACFFLLVAVVNNFAFDESPLPPAEPTLSGDDGGTTTTQTGDSPENAFPIEIGTTKFDFSDTTKEDPTTDEPVEGESAGEGDQPAEQEGDVQNDDPGNNNEGQ